MPRLLLVALCGAAGATSRYLLGVAVGVRSFPWTTLGINTVGSLALGFLLAGPAAQRLSPTTNIGLAVGFLGAFTTFSTFTYETITFVRTDRAAMAAVYVSASLALGLVAASVGYALGRAAA